AETQIVRFGNHRPFYGGEDVNSGRPATVPAFRRCPKPETSYPAIKITARLADQFCLAVNFCKKNIVCILLYS
ncbi:MAG: hypothetical protein PX637_01760, partial [Microcystis sp. M53601_WE4]|nr:hypothetical protein [Microcystis sp. M53601_WE4]